MEGRIIDEFLCSRWSECVTCGFWPAGRDAAADRVPRHSSASAGSAGLWGGGRREESSWRRVAVWRTGCVLVWLVVRTNTSLICIFLLICVWKHGMSCNYEINLSFGFRDLHPQEGGGRAGDHQGHGDQGEPGHQAESSQGGQGQNRSQQSDR